MLSLPCKMALSISFRFFYLLTFCVLNGISPTYSTNKIPSVPALYVFGDSTVDVGNHLPESDRKFYGVDLIPSLPPRFSNGMVVSDFTAILLGLPLVPPSSNYVLAQNSTTGINYAYAGAGILPETTRLTTWTFDQQIGAFNSTVTNHLNRVLSQDDLANHLRKSIFLLSFGINDFFQNLLPNNSKSPEEFASHLLSVFARCLTILYDMGARKFVVNNIWPMGCMPNFSGSLSLCNDTINNRLLPYSNSLPYMLKKLASNLPGFDFSYSDNFAFVQELIRNTKTYGITNITGHCLDPQKEKLCLNRDVYLHFDDVHATQAANNLFTQGCFNGTLCSPKNIIGLI